MAAPGVSKPLSVFEHHVAQCAIAHQAAVRAARALGPSSGRAEDRAVSALTIALIGKMHRLETLYAEMGGPAVFGTPDNELGMAEVARLFPE